MSEASSRAKTLLKIAIETSSVKATAATASQHAGIARQVAEDGESSQALRATALNFARELEAPPTAESAKRREEVMAGWTQASARLAWL